ncbi:hypothetical protein F4778DRAFT_149406 [Xylariomycetidae sp. FL2044]|nr:hypothetical protein F4778DRAFT_149406 [Xylariomycetidae sp. FL2044]
MAPSGLNCFAQIPGRLRNHANKRRSNRKAEDKAENIMLQPMGGANHNDNMSSLSDESDDVQKSSTLGVVPIDPFGTLSTMPNAVALGDYLAAQNYHQDIGGAPQANLAVHFDGPLNDNELSHNIPIAETFLQSLEGTPGAAALEGINNHNREFLALRGITSELTNQALYELACSARDDLQLFDSFPAGEFKPLYFFFYGSLMDVKQLASVCRLPDDDAVHETELKRGLVKGWKTMLWGPYPSLVPKDNGKVEGKAWLCTKPSYIQSLIKYESSAYRLQRCTVITEDGKRIKNARVFVHNGDGSDLEEGTFDLAEWKRKYPTQFSDE